MKTFITEDFLLQSDVARELYHDYAKAQPIFDYHSHLPAQQIAENHTFGSIAEAWLAGDHYKWRGMRSNGVAEKYCTGDATPKEKFLAYARTVPKAVRNPLYHWTHLELKSYFGIDDLLDETSAEAIWENANAQLAQMPVHELLKKSNVAVVCTTDDPVDSLEAHQKIQKDGISPTRVYPTFRPDKAMWVDRPGLFNPWLDQLSAVSAIECNTLSNLLAAIDKRHEFFHQLGGRVSDHGLDHCEAEDCTESEAARIFDTARVGRAVTPEEASKFRSYMMVFFGHLDAKRGWTKQLHLGPLRNNSTRLFKAIGPDIGCDSIGDWPQAISLSRYLDKLDCTNQLPKTILYNLNPADNYVLGTMIGNFQDGSIPGKIQFGSGWWFLDQKEGIERQLNALSSLGLLSRFVGMLTDSRSFLSFPRHEYFRRILCNLIGNDVVRGELPRDMKLLGEMVADISFRNAKQYLGLAL
ncbi:TPA: glucuronate isomerase [Candidatus Sumerlaeota bacterium]|nr:glucuronate isomerase [Candidatus Sumerlaeota bacterium]